MSIEKTFAVLEELDRLKLVMRQAYIAGGDRRENSAEHSWHLALAVWLLARQAPRELDLEKALKMALVHDICEIDAGDTPIHQEDQSGKFERERACMARLREIFPESLDEWSSLWHEYEERASLESKWVAVADRLLPFMHNVTSGGKTWRKYGVCRSQVLALHAPLAEVFPEAYAWLEGQVTVATEKGWLRDA